jgi:hypothetical protein
MWLLNWLPNWIFYAIFFIGLLSLLATYFMKFIPFLYVYRTPIQAASIVAIIFGTYMSGAISNEEAWLAKVSEMESKVKEVEIQSIKENTKIETKVVEKLQIVKQKGDEVVQYIDREVVKYDNQCVIPKEFVEAHNKAVEAPK